jgi:uncharacterized protein YcfL
MKKVIISCLIIFLLAGCTSKDSVEKNATIDSVFKEELVAVSKIGEAKGRKLPDH